MIYVNNPKANSQDALVFKTDFPLNLASVSATIPGRLRIVDFDHDGFVDIIMTVVNTDQTTRTIVYTNVDGSADGTPRSLEPSSSLSKVTDVASNRA
jgi:hypothetical protein